MANRTWQSRGSNTATATGNWGGSAPSSSDVVIFDGTSSVPCADGDLSAATGVTLRVMDSYFGAIGSNSLSTPYLQIGATSTEIGCPSGPTPGPGIGRCNINHGTQAATVTIHQTARTGIDPGQQPVRILTDHADAVVRNLRGFAQIAAIAGEAAELERVETGEIGVPDGDAFTLVGSGTDVDEVVVRGGTCLVRSAADSITVLGGHLIVDGSATVAAITQYGGTVTKRGSGTVTAMTSRGGKVDVMDGTISTLTLDGKVQYYKSDTATVGSLVVSEFAVSSTQIGNTAA